MANFRLDSRLGGSWHTVDTSKNRASGNPVCCEGSPIIMYYRADGVFCEFGVRSARIVCFYFMPTIFPFKDKKRLWRIYGWAGV